MAERSRMNETALTDAGAAPWSLAQGRLENPEPSRTYWLATMRPDGAPHVMPVIGAWLDGAFYFVSREKTRKGRNLAGEPRCVVAVSSTTLPSLDLIIDGRAEQVTEETTLDRVTDVYRSKLGWPLECAVTMWSAQMHQPPDHPPTRCSGSRRRPPSACPASPAWTSWTLPTCLVQHAGT
jgi:hypothetical protein